MKKVEFRKYSGKFPKKFTEMKKKIQEVLGDIDIHHVGSSAVTGLGGKGIVDILIGTVSWKNIDKTVDKLQSIGFIHVHLKENGRIFLSTQKNSQLDDYHIHIVKTNTKQYQEILKFRDLLRENAKLRNEYQKIKLTLMIDTNYDRKKYSKAKDKFIENILNYSKN